MTDATRKRGLTAHEVAAIEGVNVATVRDWARKGLVPSYRAPGGRTLRFPPDYAEQAQRLQAKRTTQQSPSAA